MLHILMQGYLASNATNVTAAALNILNSTVFNPAAISQGVVVYIQQTLTVLIEILAVLAVSMQIARGYFVRILKKFTLRLAADLWWLIFVVLRDASILLVVLLGMVLFWPAANLAYPVGVPFMPLAINLFAFAVVIIMMKDTDEEPKYDTIVTLLVGFGTLLFLFGNTFVTESALQLSTLPPTVSTNSGNPWGFLYTYFNSVKNPSMEIYSFYLTFTLLVLTVIAAAAWSFKTQGGMPRRAIVTNPKPIVKQPAPPQQK